jgi:hypothetical protein
MAAQSRRTLSAEAKLMRASVKYARPLDADDSGPDDDNVFRYALSRRLLTNQKMPRRCREGIYRRSKHCLGPDMRCLRDFPPPAMTPEQDRALRAALYRTLTRMVTEKEREADANGVNDTGSV